MYSEEEYLAALRQITELKGELSKAQRRYAAVTEFMSHTSHEIRTPMNSIISLATIGEEENYGRSSCLYFKQIRESAEYQLEILNDILDMARIESGSVTLYPEPYSLEDLADNLSTIISPMMDQKNIDFSLEFHDMFADTLVVDKLRLRQIFLNLLSNAAKFTPEKGKVEMTVSQLAASGGKVRTVFVVKDNGVGMSAEFIDKMFTPFAQERTAASAEIQGTGLGLPIAKQLTELMDGTMRVKSALGVGTTFTVEIDCMPAGEAGSTEKSVTGNIDLSGKRALIIDDHSINRILEVKLLRRAGFETEAVNNGYEGLKKFSSSEPYYYDIILMDVKMPVMDGLEATEKIRALERPDAKTVKIVAMSANAYPEDIERSAKAGMDTHIAKPVIPAVLYSSLSKLFADEDKH